MANTTTERLPANPRKHRDRRRTGFILCFLLPPLIVYGIFYLLPFAQAFVYSLFDWSGYSRQMTFVGLDNFKEAFQDKIVWKALGNNFFFLFWCTLVTFALSFFFAVCFTRLKIKGTGFFRIVYFFPNTLSIVVVGVLWMFIFNPSFGLLNGVLDFLGLSSLIQDWLGDKKVVMAALVAPQSWMYIGFYMVLFISAIQSVPEDYYEAATLDGAGQWRQLVHVTVPLIWGTFRTALIHFVVNAFEKTFALVRVVTAGGPNHASEVMTTYLYDQAFKFGHYGYGSAIGVILFAVIALMSLLVMKLTKREAYEY